MAITQEDLAAVLAKMGEGEFVTLFVVKGGPTQGGDEVVAYPGDGVPMDAGTAQSVLGGFLTESPVPLDETPNEDDTGYENTDEDGNPVPLYSNLEWIAQWVEDQVRGTVDRGLKKIAAADFTSPME